MCDEQPLSKKAHIYNLCWSDNQVSRSTKCQ